MMASNGDPVATTRAPTPVSYSIALQDLTVPQIHAELSRLSNSETRLRETNTELNKEEYRDEQFAVEAVSENEAVLQSYEWRREIIGYELRRRGLLSMPGVHEGQTPTGDVSSEESGEQGIEL
ncbi:protein of unknown function [Taphrina deformans PYCC 5710]|uniref:Uncharacterized protein n=1 Tax=Taphrina deformans (strain PYCC 5710 / ATCC 11124 / CBS 356.35 / IMI 108563 / JCM 9778 / NBRC 8474) TaxID=1097556 RepID=R4XH48_TAPDE|nr:protein of unknown function [Taphrina deformans PYCC 5710]|eukprot:CCG85117.1 protein of unknown function [Taphrina deformans PYCC 5710]